MIPTHNTAATERIGQMPRMPWLATADMIEGYENDWAEANSGVKPYLLYNESPNGAKPDRLPPPVMSAGEMQMMMSMREAVKGAVGQHDASIGKDTNQQSGRALIALERSSDVANFVFSDNLRMAVSYVGRVFLEWLPVIYDARRFITIRHENGEVDTIEINKVGENGELINDMAGGVYDQHVTTGPAYSTLRQQASENQMALYKAVPELVPVTIDIALANMDWPGAQQMAKRARKMVPKQYLDESELTEEEKNAEPPPPTPAEEVAMKQTQADSMGADADIAQAEAKKVTASATVKKAEATIVEAEAGVKLAQSNIMRGRQDLLARRMDNGPAAEKAENEPNNGESAPITRKDFEAFKTEIAQVIAQTIRGASNG